MIWSMTEWNSLYNTTNLQKLCDDALNVVAHVPRHGEGGAVADGEGNIETVCNRLSEQSFAGTGWAKHHDVRLFKPEEK